MRKEPEQKCMEGSTQGLERRAWEGESELPQKQRKCSVPKTLYFNPDLLQQPLCGHTKPCLLDTGVIGDASVNILPLHVTGYQCSLCHCDRAITAFKSNHIREPILHKSVPSQRTQLYGPIPLEPCLTPMSTTSNRVLSEKQNLWEWHACGTSHSN